MENRNISKYNGCSDRDHSQRPDCNYANDRIHHHRSGCCFHRNLMLTISVIIGVAFIILDLYIMILVIVGISVILSIMN